jgi:hypothetical protein
MSAAVEVVRLIYVAIAESGPLGVPAGTVYAALMAHGCSLQQYEKIEATMVRSGLIRKSGNLLHACEPGVLP